jgi:hypothetical protein
MTERMVHVAHRDEGRGRVILQVRSSRPDPVAVDAAMHVAKAFQSRLESVFLEDRERLDVATYDFTREVSICGRHRRPLTPQDVVQGFVHDRRLAHREIEAKAAAAEVPLTERVMRDDPVRALAISCAEAGPWNLIALAEPFEARNGALLEQMITDVADATGFLLVGPHAKASAGPLVIALEDIERLPALLRAGRLLAADDDAAVCVLLLADTRGELQDLEGQTRLLLRDRVDLTIISAPPTRGHPGAAAEAVRRAGAGFVIAQWGSVLVPDASGLAWLAAVIEGPLLLVR